MPTLLWEPPAEMVERALMTRYMREQGKRDYEELWRWSVDDLDGFWASIWDEYRVGPRSGPVLARDAMPGAAELDHVQAVVVGLHQPGQRSALAQRGHVAGRGHRAQHGWHHGARCRRCCGSRPPRWPSARW